MIPNKQLNILQAWKNNPFVGLSISEIMEMMGKNTKTWVFTSLKNLAENKLVISNRKGNIDLYSLNLNNPFLIDILQYLDVQKHIDFAQMDLVSELISKIPEINCCILVFGSYVSGKQKRDSDLDLCFLVDNKSAIKKIKPYVNEIKLNHVIGLDEHYITFSEFVKMLLREEENLGKQIFRKNILFYNADIYYRLLQEAHKNGFRP